MFLGINKGLHGLSLISLDKYFEKANPPPISLPIAMQILRRLFLYKGLA